MLNEERLQMSCRIKMETWLGKVNCMQVNKVGAMCPAS